MQMKLKESKQGCYDIFNQIKTQEVDRKALIHILLQHLVHLCLIRVRKP